MRVPALPRGVRGEDGQGTDVPRASWAGPFKEVLRGNKAARARIAGLDRHAGGGAEGVVDFDEIAAEDARDLSSPLSRICPDMRRAPDWHFLRRTLRREAFNALASIRTARGTTLDKALVGAKHWRVGNDTGHVGVLAADADAYEVFKDVINPVLALLGTLGALQPPSVLGSLGSGFTMERATMAAVHSVKLTVWRSLDGVLLPPAMGRVDRAATESALVEAFVQVGGKFAGAYHALRGSDTFSEMDAKTEATLHAKGLLPTEPDDPAALAWGLNRDWPHGRGVYANRGRTVYALFNVREHLELSVEENSANVAAALTRMEQLALRLDAALTAEGGRGFAKSQRLGFLASDPQRLGAAMTVCLRIRAPNVRTADDRHAWCERRGLVLREGPEDTVEVQNAVSLGMDELQVVRRVVDGASALVDYEQELAAAQEVL